MGLGVLVSAALVELLPAPRVLPYVLLFVLFAIAFAAHAAAAGAGRRAVAPAADAAAAERAAAWSAGRSSWPALGVLSSWSIGGLFLSLGPQLSAEVFHTSNHLVAGIPRVRARRLRPPSRSSCSAAARRGSAPSLGSIALAIGLLLIVAAAGESSSALLLIGAVIGGAGFGVAFLGALRALSVAIPHEHRAEVMSAFYVVAYASLSLPAVLAGVVVTALGLRVDVRGLRQRRRRARACRRVRGLAHSPSASADFCREMSQRPLT